MGWKEVTCLSEQGNQQRGPSTSRGARLRAVEYTCRGWDWNRRPADGSRSTYDTSSSYTCEKAGVGKKGALSENGSSLAES